MFSWPKIDFFLISYIVGFGFRVKGVSPLLLPLVSLGLGHESTICVPFCYEILAIINIATTPALS